MIQAPKRIFSAKGGSASGGKPGDRTIERKRTPSKWRVPEKSAPHREISPEREAILRFVPLGGLEEIGRNCAFFEYGNEIVVIDVGIQFPEEETPGIDYIIPNMTYLEPKKKNVRGIILTHGHYDHIHALPYVIEKLGNPIIYAVEFTKALIETRFQEFPNLPKPKIQIVKGGDRVALSEHFTAEFFYVDHTIPDAMGFILETPAGKMAHFGDFRVEYDSKGKAQ